MPRYIIEREIPGAGALSAQELQAISQKSCGVLRELGPQVQWVRSHVTADKVYCEYIAPDEASIHEHARLGGFPANAVSRVFADWNGQQMNAVKPRVSSCSSRSRRRCATRWRGSSPTPNIMVAVLRSPFR